MITASILRCLGLASLLLPLCGLILPCAADEKTTTAEIGDIKLEVPAGWKKEEPSNRLRLAQYSVPAAEGEEPGELAIFSFGASGLEANVERWVGQFNSAERTIKKAKADCPLGQYYWVDIVGTYNKPVGPPVLGKTEPTPNTRVINVMLEVKDKGTYFFKLVGSDATVKGQADALRKMFGGDAKKEQVFE